MIRNKHCSACPNVIQRSTPGLSVCILIRHNQVYGNTPNESGFHENTWKLFIITGNGKQNVWMHVVHIRLL